MEVDAIVNSANNDLILGAGVSGAIRRIGGPTIQEECHAIGTIPLGEAVVTTGGNLKAKWIIHAATNPLGLWANAKSVRNAMKTTLKRAIEKGFKKLAVPAIGSGSGGFPVDICANVLYDVVAEHAAGETPIEEISFVCLDEKSFKVFEEKFIRRFPAHWTEMTGKPVPELPPEDDKKPLPEDLVPIVVPRRIDDRRGPPRRDDRPPRPEGPRRVDGPRRDDRRPGPPPPQRPNQPGPRRDDRGPRRGPPPPNQQRRDRRDRGPRPPRPQGPPPPPRPPQQPPPPPPSPSAPPPAPPTNPA